MFKKAQRKAVKMKMAVIGTSGSGKTYSALLIAKGLGGNIAVIDSENDSASLYSDLTDFDTCPIKPPFTPQKYIDTINEAEKEGYTTLIIDSFSHVWSGEGGILQMVRDQEKVTHNSFTAWNKVTPIYDSLINTILQSNMHIIVTMRSKTAYEIQENDKGKKAPVKVGLAPVQRDGLEYEFTTVLEINNESHIAIATKDRTNIFGDEAFKPSEETGKQIIDWLSSGVKVYKDKFVHITGEEVELVTRSGFKNINEFTHEELEKMLTIDSYKQAFPYIEKIISEQQSEDDKILERSLDEK
jgi:ABC-type dipeptide/oligopeptide/nickel transport system ATPase component